LKPSNVLFAGKSLRIADLGLGAVMPQGNVATRLRSIANTTQEARGAGTALYMAPEQKRGESQHTTQDVYSLGVIWYQLLVNDFNCSPGPTWRKSLEERGSRRSTSIC
jgi:serine/threonine protein kinase